MPVSAFKQGSLTVTGYFERILFELSQGSSWLQESLFRELGEFGLRFEDIQEAGVYSGPANWSISCRFWGFRAELVVKVDRYEMLILNPNTDEQESVRKMLRLVENALSRTAAPASFRNRHFAYFGHYQVNTGYQSITSRLTTGIPSELGSISGTGISLYLNDPSWGGEASIVLDRSVVIPDGLFITVRRSFGRDQDLGGSSGNFADYLTSTLKVFGLTEQKK